MSVVTVTVYTAGPSCMPCTMTKKHLARRGIPYTEIPINDAGVLEAIHELDFHTAPVVCAATTAGEQAWDGYRPDRIDALAGVR